MTCSMCLLRISMHFLMRRPKCFMTRRHWSCGMSCTASTIAAFSSYKFWRSLPQSLSFKNPNKWKSRGLKAGLFALHGWRVLWLMHLVSKWFEIHCSTNLDTRGAAPSCWNHWRRRSLTPVTCRSCLKKRDKVFKYWSLLFTKVSAPCSTFEKYSSRLFYMDYNWWKCTIYYMLLYFYIFSDIMLKFLHNFSSWIVYTPVNFFSFDQKL